MEARSASVARGTRRAVQAALSWPVAGWLLRSWLDEPEPCPAARLAVDPIAAETVELLATRPTRPGRRVPVARSLLIASIAGIVGLLPAAAAGIYVGPGRVALAFAGAPEAAAIEVPSAAAGPGVAAGTSADAAHRAVADEIATRAAGLDAAWPAPTGGKDPAATGMLGRYAVLQAPLTSTATVPAPAQPLIQYRTQKGDALWVIAKRFGLSAMTVWWANDLLNKDYLKVGQLLTMPAGNGVVHVVTEGETLDSIARLYRADANAIAATNNLMAGVVILGQRLIIPAGHGPGYQPLNQTDAPAAQIVLRPSEQGNGVIPNAGPARVPNPTAVSQPSSGTAKVMVPTYAGIANAYPVAAANPEGSANSPASASPPGSANTGQSTGTQTLVTIDWANLPVSGQPVGTVPVGASGGTVYVTVPTSVPPTIAQQPVPIGGQPTVPTAIPTLPGISSQVIQVVVDLGSLFTTQFDGSAYASGNCNMASAAMLFEVQTGKDVTGAQMRAWSGATSVGTSLTDLQHAFATQRQPVTIRYGLSWQQFVHQVASGRSAVVQGWYGTLPAQYDLQPGFTAGHSVFVLGYSQHAFNGKGGFYVMDPLGRPGYSGSWWPSAVLQKYGWSGNPSLQGTDRNHYNGYVALEATASGKQLGATPIKPLFQNFWDATKVAIESALQVTVARGNNGSVPPVRGAVLMILDPRVNLTPQQARANQNLVWPIARSSLRQGFSAKHPQMDFVAKPGTAVVAPANGRVVFLSYPDAAGRVTLWVEHGPNLYTVLTGMSHINVKPGQWVNAGDTLGLVGGSGRRGSVVTFSMAAGALPGVNGSAADPLLFLRAH